MHALAGAGADVIELGVPFSDPMADGPTIQRASERALRAGTTLADVLDMVASFRRRNPDTPIVLMGYTNPIEAMGARTFAGRASVRIKCPVVLDDFSEPEPDGALLRPPRERYRDAHPRPDDVFLLIELSDATLAADRGVKLELYARAGVREVWIVDLATNTVLVHRDPAGAAYRSVVRVDASGVLEVEALPGPTIPVSALFF